MRCLLATTTAAFLLVASLGCHVTGRCDCGYDAGCCGPGMYAPPAGPAPQAAEPVTAPTKATPKTEGKE